MTSVIGMGGGPFRRVTSACIPASGANPRKERVMTRAAHRPTCVGGLRMGRGCLVRCRELMLTSVGVGVRDRNELRGPGHVDERRRRPPRAPRARAPATPKVRLPGRSGLPQRAWRKGGRAMTPHVRLSLVLGAVVSVTGCVNEGNFRKHLYFPWPCAMIHQRRIRAPRIGPALRVAYLPRSRPHSRRGEARRAQMSETWRSMDRVGMRGMRYSIAPRYATKPRATVLDAAARGLRERFPFTIRALGRLWGRRYQPLRQLHI